MTGRKIDDLLHARHRRFTPLSRLLGASDERQLWTDAVRALLPTVLAEEICVINYRAATLVLQASNAGFGTRLRYLVPELTAKLRNLAAFQDLADIRIRVSQDVVPVAEVDERRPLSDNALAALTELASILEAQQDCAELQAAVLRLSERNEGADP